ncbi:3-hydroxyacyl-thioester dehydratase HtdZ [Microbacterium kribbense]|uniref:3-hydroxyacyl-thioester dehydratase HtdZ n=1 Tax=Microbacterium kribbense TaxID=433645 RepID=A0ABP7GXW0_9MICO
MELAEPATLLEHAGEVIGIGEAHVTQEMINAFAHATSDHQWVHVDIDRARRGPYGATIAHGFLTLSLIPHFLDQVISVHDVSATINYGLEHVRFPAPVVVGTLLRAEVVLAQAHVVGDGIQAQYQVTITSAASPKPHCVCGAIVRYVRTPGHRDARPGAADEEATT